MPRTRALARGSSGAAVVASLALSLVPGPAGAHGPPDPHIRFLVDRITPAVAGVSASVHPPFEIAPPSLTVRNDSASTLEILDPGGEPFLRIGPGGVSGNTSSPAYEASRDPSAVAPTEPAGEPEWIALSKRPEWTWFDVRPDYDGPLPPGLAGRRSTVTLRAWSVPARAGPRSVSIDGRVVYKPILGSIRPRLIGTPDLPGVQVALVEGPVPAIQLRNDGAETLTVIGRDGRPFARVGPAGIEANIHSPTFSDTRNLAETLDAEPEFQHLQDSPVLVWLERRAAYAEPDPPPEIERAGRRAVLARWEVPIEAGARRAAIEGVTEWVPAAAASSGGGPGTTVLAAVAGAVALALAATGVLVARRRGRARPLA